MSRTRSRGPFSRALAYLANDVHSLAFGWDRATSRLAADPRGCTGSGGRPRSWPAKASSVLVSSAANAQTWI